MTDTHSWRGLWRLSWPLVLSMFFQFSVGLTDAWVAGRFGPQVQGAVGFVAQVLFLFNVLATALGVGLVATIARAEGAGDAGRVGHVSRQGILFAFLLAAPLSAAGYLFVPSARSLGFLPAPVAVQAEALLPACALSLVPQAILISSAAIFRARRRTGLVLLCWGGTSLLNLWWVFAFAFGQGWVPALGPRGITVATAASSVAGACLALALLHRITGPGRPPRRWRPDGALARELWRLAWPAGVLQVGWNLGGAVLYAILGSLPSGAVAATAALTNGLRIEAILYLPAFALNMVTAVLVGQALGAGDGQGAEGAGWRVASAAAGVLTLMALPVFVFSRPLAAFLSPDPLVREATHLYLRFNMASQPFMALSLCLGGGLQGAGDTRGPMGIVLGSLWGFRIPLAFLLVRFWGSTGVWAAMVCSQVLQGAGMAWRFGRGRWKALGAKGGLEVKGSLRPGRPVSEDGS